ncbi:hypothetical protein FOH24_16510 [Acetobacter tropicalis]|uniref:Uncharacterized protein n=1 Tax=Acetobacter tropicalis TaxID=104102 RepID=A0A094ZRC4_9PROT|nr:hypothetical protein [Acetobacter tropicalis]KAA8384820.1 hypothetical protein FOH24_16510 [Acetobacter tropicalis]KAA8386534.1 hypothetical protein FOH22_11320 [Acetobacter tropicalis]KGB24726.1 hypothetical protein AtDm6_1068 [Acetobacter tropicalis]MBC9008806.1 hypothetical protein [Acetobacter tropicalis]MDO8171979.1 hypothetical protein [Acetobacter tropicalis]
MSLVQTHTIVGQTASGVLGGILLPISAQPAYYNRYASDVLANMAESGRRASVAVGQPGITAGPPAYFAAQGGAAGITSPVSADGDLTVLVAARYPSQMTANYKIAPLVSNYFTDADGKWQGFLFGLNFYSDTQILPILWAVESETGSTNQQAGDLITTAQGQAWGLYSIRISSIGSKGWTATIKNHTLGTTKTITSSNTIPVLSAAPNLAVGTSYLPENFTDRSDILSVGIWHAALSDTDLDTAVDFERRWQAGINGVTL